jgi:hypothetical protein
MIHIFPYPTKEPHCLDLTGMCGCKPVTHALCPACNGIGIVSLDSPELDSEDEITPVTVHRNKGRLIYGAKQSPYKH